MPEGLDVDTLGTLQRRLEKELREQGGNYPLRVVWGRKPE